MGGGGRGEGGGGLSGDKHLRGDRVNLNVKQANYLVMHAFDMKNGEGQKVYSHDLISGVKA